MCQFWLNSLSNLFVSTNTKKLTNQREARGGRRNSPFARHLPTKRTAGLVKKMFQQNSTLLAVIIELPVFRISIKFLYFISRNYRKTGILLETGKPLQNTSSTTHHCFDVELAKKPIQLVVEKKFVCAAPEFLSRTQYLSLVEKYIETRRHASPQQFAG